MARRVFWHIGLPKTGTTYLQGILWDNQEALRASGLLLPGIGHREHLWAALEVQERDMTRRAPKAAGAWERVIAEIEAFDGDVLLTHEFFCGATREQAERAIARLAPAEIHVIVTARHTAAMFAAGWQERVKNGGVADLRALAATGGDAEFGWRTWDLGDVLERWTTGLPADQVHVLPMPGRNEPADRHWQNFREVLGLPDAYAAPPVPANRRLGVVQVELLRRMNRHLLEAMPHAVDRGTLIRGYLAEEKLADQESERFALPAELLEECRARAGRAVELIRARGLHVMGDPTSLLVPAQLPAAREVESVTEAEMLEAAGQLLAAVMLDHRKQSRQLAKLRKREAERLRADEADKTAAKGRWRALRRARRHAPRSPQD